MNSLKSNIIEIREKIFPLVPLMIDLYKKYDEFQMHFKKCTMNIESYAVSKLIYDDIKINFSNLYEITINLTEKYNISICEYQAPNQYNDFSWNFTQSLADELVINNSTFINLPISDNSYVKYNIENNKFTFHSMEFDDYNFMIMQLSTTYSDNFYDYGSITEIISIVKDLKNLVPSKYTLSFTNIYNYIDHKNIKILMNDLENAIDSFSRKSS